MSRPNYLNKIKKNILDAEYGTVFVAVDFVSIADKKTVNMSLLRLEEEGIILRIIRGVYYKVAHAIARNFGWTIVPCGDTALNILGLSTQVPVVWSYVSDGAYKEYTYDNTTIKFKRTTNKEISKLSYKTALIVQALKAFGKNNIDRNVIERLKNNLTNEEKINALIEAKTATSWIYEYIKQVCKGDEK